MLSKEALSTTKWYQRAGHEIARILGANTERGLSDDEVTKRLKAYGQNTFKKGDEENLLDILLRQVANPLSIILIIAGILTLVLREYSDAIVIFLAVGLNILIGAYQEYRANRAFQALSASQAKFTTALRAGREQTIAVEDLVPGDTVLIAAGSYIPADIRLVSSQGLNVNESALTGEWTEIDKSAKAISGDHPIHEQTNLTFMGTLATSGSARGVVVATGEETEIGRIAKTLGYKQEETPFQESIRKLSHFLIGVVVVTLILVIILGITRGEPVSTLILIAIALAVAAIPEGLPVAVTVVLAFGMQAISKFGGLVRNLLAAETLGSTTVILTDKTGTLTEADMEVELVATLSDPRGESVDEEVLKRAVLTSDAFIESADDKIEKNEIKGRPVERAITLAGVRQDLYKKYLHKHYQELDFEPFSSEKRYAASLNLEPKSKQNAINVTGAPEVIMSRSESVYMGDGRELKLTKERFLELEEIQSSFARDGKRLLAVGYKKTNKQDLRHDLKHTIDGLVFLGFLVLHDPVRSGVPEAIEKAKGAGAKVYMLTGDQAPTALAIAREVGICGNEGRALTGSEIEHLSDQVLLERFDNVNVFARVLPHQKLRIANLLKSQGEVVAMTGDGINDAPALRSADIGIAIGSGTEVAKESSDLVLVNNGFDIIVRAIEEGRRILDNLKKVVAYLLSTGFSEIVVVVGALIAGSALPILPVQILWANIIGEGFMNFAFAFEPAEKDIMDRDPRSESMRTILSKNIKLLILILAGVTSVMVLALFFILEANGVPIEKIRTVIFVAISAGSIFFALSIKNLKQPIWKIPLFSNRYLIGSLILSLGMLAVALFVGPVSNLLGVVPLSAIEVLGLVGFGLLNLVIIEIVKYTVFKRRLA